MRTIWTLLGILAMSATAYGQADTDIVNIPDSKFKQELIEDDEINTDGDDEITYGEARAYTGSIYVPNRSITTLEGIEAFINITKLTCYSNNLTELDISKNTALKELECFSNQLENLDVSKNIALTKISCFANNLTALDVSKNVLLTILDCSRNQLTSLNVHENTALIRLSCFDNQLTSLDVSNNLLLQNLYCDGNQLANLNVSKNTALRELKCFNNQLTQLNLANGNNSRLRTMVASGNPNLSCIQIDPGFSSTSSWRKDATASYNENCNYQNLSAKDEKIEKTTAKILNPVENNLIIKTEAKIEKVDIYNPTGQLIKVLLKENIAVQDLQKGIYYIVITTNKGIIAEKIIKK